MFIQYSFENDIYTITFEPRSDKRALNDVDDVIEKRRVKVAS